MLGAALLIPELLTEIMLCLPSSIDNKFAFAQVSRFWRGVALDSPLFWSSFSGGGSELDLHRLPMVLSRSDSNTVLHVEFRFTFHSPESKEALEILVLYAARIESLDLSVGNGAEFFEVTALLGSYVEFPALRTLRVNLKGNEYTKLPRLALKAPQLRTLDLNFISRGAVEWETLLVPSLENIRVYNAGGATVETLSLIFEKCPRAWRVALHEFNLYGSDHADDYFEVFARRPLAPALRELELQLEDRDLTRVLKTGFSDVLLPTLTGSIYQGALEMDLDTLTGALLPGVGPLLFFQLLDDNDRIELHDDAGHIRRLECWDADATFDGSDAWNYLSRRYDLHKTVREIRVVCTADYEWWRYAEAFELFPPQQDGIILGVQFIRWTHQEDPKPIVKRMPLPGLAKIEFLGPKEDWDAAEHSCPLVPSMHRALAHIEPPTGRKVEVCVGNVVERMQDGELATLKTALSDPWVLCSHCVHR